MSKPIAVFGAGPGLGQAVARRREPLELLAQELADNGASAHVITADLADTRCRPRTGPADSRCGRRMGDGAILTAPG